MKSENPISLKDKLTYLRSWALLEKLLIVQLLKNILAFYGTRKFITVFTGALHCSLSWVTSIQSYHPTLYLITSILILSTYLRLVFPVISFLLTFPPISYNAFLFSPIRATCPAQYNPTGRQNLEPPRKDVVTSHNLAFKHLWKQWSRNMSKSLSSDNNYDDEDDDILASLYKVLSLKKIASLFLDLVVLNKIFSVSGRVHWDRDRRVPMRL
jgi:hypothetical protein